MPFVLIVDFIGLFPMVMKEISLTIFLGNSRIIARKSLELIELKEAY